jgi:hypothetical protein
MFESQSIYEACGTHSFPSRGLRLPATSVIDFLLPLKQLDVTVG